MNSSIVLSDLAPVNSYSPRWEKWGKNLMLSLSLATGSVLILNTNSVEARRIPVCISYIPEKYGTLSLELGVCEFYSHHRKGKPYQLEAQRNTNIKDRLNIGKMFGIIWGDIVNLLGNVINTINETLSLLAFWAIHIKLINLAGALFNLLISITILLIDVCILLFEMVFFFIFIPLAFFL